MNQQHNIRWALKNLPDDIRRSKETEERISKDVATREANTSDQTAQVRAKFKGFEIVSRGHALGRDNDPELYVRGALTYRAQLNPENPLGTIQSIEHVLRSLDRRAEDEKQQIQRQEKALSEYKEQLDRPFEHEERLKELGVSSETVAQIRRGSEGEMKALLSAVLNHAFSGQL